ncbi:hypothetical protein SAMN02910418_00217 [Bowdeniella nasicola]|uniref:Uncharacterized protein n=1 Tax=Bowdeniella nasicola TaxID=208480 RepID=A0A1H3VSC6_9ACTO|nr:hypothetical protein [Bowdeniella nasicola]SDZ77725.1 hypothetical protein SAMN02910418_00217 [Bowdeniella nasicola]
MLGRWVYADSVYVSGARQLGEELARAGFDVFDVSRVDGDMSEGDIAQDD